nr:HesA/MoeB/ThiF family protein [Allomuricauda sp.]
MANRYIRQTSLPDFGEKSQKKLANTKVLVVGLGGLGLPVVQYLNAMGVGTLGLIDHDIVDIHNLQRQVLYSELDVGHSKLDTVLEKLALQNSNTVLEPYDTFLTKENVLKIIGDYDLVVDATDNFSTRYLINDACVILEKPFIYGALHGFEGHVSVFNYQNGPTYRCLYPEMPSKFEVPNCDENGVLGVVPGIIGTLQALEAVKVITRLGEILSGKLLIFDGLAQNYLKIDIKARPENKNIKTLQDSYDASFCEQILSITASDFQKLRTSNESFLLVDVRTEAEFLQNHLEEAHNVPMNSSEIPNEILSKNQPLYMICQSGIRSKKAVLNWQKKYPNHTFYTILGGMNRLMTLAS